MAHYCDIQLKLMTTFYITTPKWAKILGIFVNGRQIWSPKWIKRSKFDDCALHAHKTHLLIKCLVATWFLHETCCEQLAFLVVSG